MAAESGQGGIKINQLEYAYAVEAFDPEAEYIKVYVPKLMSNVTAKPATESKPVNKGVFENASSCQVSGASSVSTQGYIVARVVDKVYHNHPHLQCNNAQYGTDNCPNRVHDNTCPHKSMLKPCYHDHWHFHFNNEPVGGGYIPAGAQLIVLFMDGNINDCWVTRFICHY